MPTALRFNGLRAVIYPNDHRPAHVHVMGHGCEAVFNLRGGARERAPGRTSTQARALLIMVDCCVGSLLRVV
ncbi:DUF4160 domain-containing protein [Azotobacter beijerinckii]|uniref:DUF4160 domain-containing protein n=1 Tax=Azotobacter beijerinckii TaxID=170623 RepID=UPI000B807894